MTTNDRQQIEQLVVKTQHGDSQAFAKIYDCFVSEIYRYILFKINDVNDAQDLTAETFKRAWSYIARYKSNNFRAYLYAIARNLCFDFYKQNKNQTSLELIKEVKDETESLEQKVIVQEIKTELKSAITKLPNKYREIIILRFMNELSIKETSIITGMSSAAVRTTQTRAIGKLKILLK